MAAACPETLDAPQAERFVVLVSKDDKKFRISAESASISRMIDAALRADPRCEEVNVLVDAATLARVVEYMEHHKGLEAPRLKPPLTEKDLSKCHSDQWDVEFIGKLIKPAENKYDRPIANLYNLILAANYLLMDCLMSLGCAQVASMARGQAVDKIQEVLEPSP